jgi:hypothetical protein
LARFRNQSTIKQERRCLFIGHVNKGKIIRTNLTETNGKIKLSYLED